jgi:hypothetical protein
VKGKGSDLARLADRRAVVIWSTRLTSLER